ncbi:NlpC/P60 family protein [Streptomyces sp. NBC_01317]|uniref:C40 family peptidase n=1 Tax=Streptomyces sp. NBC_01317 TaxID=2903822 RepID=UPI002E14F239|nr:NlpC/P60 family protein [Streptomyces sp. NBC_01317]
MASHRRPKQPNRARVTVLTVTAAAAVALTSQAANAAPKPSKAEVKEQVDKLYHEAEVANEKLHAAEDAQDKLEKQVGTLQDKVANGQDDLNDLRDELGSIASAQYRTGGIDPSIQLFLSSDPDTYLEKASTLDQVSAKQAETLQQIQAKQRSLAQQRTEAQDKVKDLADARKQLADNKKEVQKKLAAAQQVLNTLTAKERAALVAADAERASRGNDRVDLGDTPAPASGRAAAALAAAKTQLGKPYISGAEGPNAYDCSGLVQWSYAQAGVQLTRTTYTQANEGTRIARSELAPGDLVFFSGLSHVALYVGNGQVIHAPKPGAVVRYEAMEWAGSYQFGVRI